MSKKKKPIPPKPQILTREDMANSQLGRILGMKQIDVTTTKKDDLGLSPSEIRENKKRKNLGRSKDKMAPSSKIKGEKEKDLKRLEQIKKNQAAEDAAKKKKAKGKGPKLGGEFTGPRKNVLKRMNMGGVMKNRGGMFKGTY
jgi:hypothetical protein|tara:strand:+ start:47 stop:472 length:426 start_codon:yes stop_codon:yes gene_type:complete